MGFAGHTVDAGVASMPLSSASGASSNTSGAAFVCSRCNKSISSEGSGTTPRRTCAMRRGIRTWARKGASSAASDAGSAAVRALDAYAAVFTTDVVTAEKAAAKAAASAATGRRTTAGSAPSSAGPAGGRGGCGGAGSERPRPDDGAASAAAPRRSPSGHDELYCTFFAEFQN